MTPGRAFELRGSNYDWQYKTTLIDRPEYTRVEKPNTRGKVLGGSSCTHYHTWVRGSKATYDDWVEYGGQTWDYAHCEKYFSKVRRDNLAEYSLNIIPDEAMADMYLLVQ